MKCDYAGLRGGSVRRGRRERHEPHDEDMPPRKKARTAVEQSVLPTIRVTPRPITRSGNRAGGRSVEGVVEETPISPAGGRVSPEPRARMPLPPVNLFFYFLISSSLTCSFFYRPRATSNCSPPLPLSTGRSTISITSAWRSYTSMSSNAFARMIVATFGRRTFG